MIKILVSQNTRVMKEMFDALATPYRVEKFWLPETGLHPVEFVHSFCETLLDGCYSDTKYVATHSKDLVSALGDLVEDGVISKDVISIHIIDGDGSITESRFNDEGSLINWQIGFFTCR